MKFRRCLSAVLCIIFILALTIPLCDTVEVAALSKEEYQDRIEELEDEQREIEEEINKLNSEKAEQKAKKQALQRKIDNLQNQINAYDERLNELNAERNLLENEIEEKNKDLENVKYVFKQRLRAIYMSGGTQNSNLAVILSSDDLGDLLAKNELTKSITAYDKALTERIVVETEEIKKKQDELSVVSAEQTSAKSEIDARKKELNEQIEKINSQLGNITDEVDTLESQASKIDKAIAEYESAIKAAENVGSDQKYDGNFSWPLPGYYRVTSPYGYRTHPISGKWKFHKGIDIADSGCKGKPIVAAADGIVSIASYNKGGYGNYVMINHGTADDGKKYVTLYAHMTRYIVKVGQKVKKGQTIGYVGTTGASKGYHLHFEIRANGSTTNPLSYY